MNHRRSITLAAAASIGAVGLVAGWASAGGADEVIARARLIDGAGAPVGQVKFTVEADGLVKGRAVVHLPAGPPEFRGFHIHANADGLGCIPGTGFTGVGGHWDVGSHDHGAHTGDLPSLHLTSSGRAELVFAVDKFVASQLVGKAVIVHAGPDNFGNVPRGTAANQYTDNGTAYSGTGGTASTGNAGVRVACGVIEAS